MISLSVNVNKVATLRNSRGGREPSVIEAVRVCLSAGVHGITVHPRADRRHITPDDVRGIAAELRARDSKAEFNIEGDPRDELIALVHEILPDQCTLVPVVPGEITSQAGWVRGRDTDALPDVVAAMKAKGIRVSLFVDPDLTAIALAHEVGADRVELYTEPFARAFERGASEAAASLATYQEASQLAAQAGMGVNAGHDLDLHNLGLFRTLAHLDEVSIGHAIMSRALFVGLETVIREYLAVLR